MSVKTMFYKYGRDNQLGDQYWYKDIAIEKMGSAKTSPLLWGDDDLFSQATMSYVITF